MKKPLLYFAALLALTGITTKSLAQVANPEVTPVKLSRTGWTATANSESVNEGTNGPGQMVLDNNNATYWHTEWDPMTTLPGILTVDMKASKSYQGIFLRPRAGASSNCPKNITISISNDGTAFTDVQSFVVERADKDQFFKFTSGTQNSQYIRVTVNTIHETDPAEQSTMLSEFGVVNFIVKDKSAYDRTGWAATGTSTNGTGGSGDSGGYAAIIDNDQNTYWHSNYGGTSDPQVYPHEVTFDMGVVQPVNLFTFKHRNGPSRDIKDYELWTSTNGTDFTQFGGTYQFTDDNNTQVLKLGSVLNIKAFRIKAINAWDGDNFAALAEARAHYDRSYDRTGWVVTASDEATNEGTINTRNAIIDYDPDSYWHSNYATPAPQTPYPHTLTIDMGVQQPVKAFTFMNRSNGQYRMQNFELWTSEDGSAFTQSGGTLQFANDNNMHALELGTVLNIKAFRIVVLSSYTAGDLAALGDVRAYNDVTSLPVTLTSFTAKANKNSVNLAWATASELNASHYNVTRSIDGVNFAKIGRVTAANKASNYVYTDFSPAKGTNYYQLIEEDFDGKTQKSEVVSAKIAVPATDLTIESVTSEGVTVRVYSPKAANGKISVTNMLGQKLANQAVSLQEGYTKVTLPVQVSQMVVVTVTTSEVSVSKKAIK